MELLAVWRHNKPNAKYQAELNFLWREKLFQRNYLEYLNNKIKSGDMAVLEITFRNVSMGKWSKN